MRYRDQCFPSDTMLRVEYADQIHRAQLVNVSTTGARLRDLDLPAVGSRVTLCFPHLRFPARVVWSSSREVGVRFVLALLSPDLNMLCGTGGGRAAGWGGSYGLLRELS